ncbi:MAG TPA: hypothetical protein VMZ22_07925 [Acidimicrobiales bacterium]|nr:hypothetical protein [Acidimicrobiales bacterium]
MTLFRRWLPVLIAIAGSLFVQKVLFEPRYDVSGHAGGHLSTASAPFGGFVLVVTLLYTTRRALRQPIVLVTCAAWMAATALVLIGNVRVVDALVRAGERRTPTGLLRASPTIDSAHWLADVAPWFGVVSALSMIVAFALYRQVSKRVAVGAAIVTLIVPPWIVPGAGVVVLVVARVLAFHRGQPGRSLAIRTSPQLRKIPSS